MSAIVPIAVPAGAAQTPMPENSVPLHDACQSGTNEPPTSGVQLVGVNLTHFVTADAVVALVIKHKVNKIDKVLFIFLPPFSLFG